MQTEDEFQAALDAEPTCSTTRQVFADWLDEKDDIRAEGYRALGVLGLYPSICGTQATFGGMNHPNATERVSDWGWLQANKDWLLPIEWFNLIPYLAGNDWELDTRKIWIRRDTRRELEDRVTKVFHLLPEDIRMCLLGLIESKKG